MMQITTTPSVQARSSAFGGLAASALGIAVSEAGCSLLGMPAAAHVMNTLVGVALMSLTLRRYLCYWPSAARPDGRAAGRSRIAALPGRIACLLIGLAGYLAATTLSSGFVSLFMLYACALVLAPWAHLARTRADCLAYATASAIGIGMALVADVSRLNPVLLLLVACTLWMSTIAGWGCLALEERRRQRNGMTRIRF